jgi:hypothetical protein
MLAGTSHRRLCWPVPRVDAYVGRRHASTHMLAGATRRRLCRPVPRVDAYVGRPGHACRSRIDAYVRGDGRRLCSRGRSTPMFAWTVDAYVSLGPHGPRLPGPVDAYVRRAVDAYVAALCRSHAACRGRRADRGGALAPRERSRRGLARAACAVRCPGTADGLGSMWTGAVALAAGRMQWPYPRTGDPRVRG